MFIAKGTRIPGTLHIVLNDGDYASGQLVEAATTLNPDVSVCAYSAHFVLTGEQVSASSVDKVIDKHGFRQLFTLSEQIALDNFEDNLALSAQQKAVLKTLFANFDSADEVHIDTPEVMQALQIFAQLNFINQSRIPAILRGEKQV